MKQRFFLIVLAFFFSFFGAQAQRDSVNLYRKLDRLFNILNMADAFSTSAKTSADQTITNAPALSGHEAEARFFFDKYVGWPAFKDDLSKIYARFYSEGEIDELLRFYQTPAGKKTLTNLPLQQEIVTRQAAKLQEHANDLNKLVNPAQPDSVNHK
jgi:hypothetical protein